jgi:hypothetical protein
VGEYILLSEREGIGGWGRGGSGSDRASYI